MKHFASLLFALCIFTFVWGQGVPGAQMWFDSGTLYHGDKSVSLNSDNFAGTVKTWAVDKVHIAVSAETAPEVISQLLMSVPFKDVSYSLTLDKDRIAASAATELYYRNLPQTEGIPFTSAPTQPRFVDGKMEDWVKNRADALYPRECWENGIEGRVMVQFTIDEQGRTGNVIILRKAAPQLDRIAERIVLDMPDWKPGLDENGNPIKVSYNLPIVFKH